MTDTERQEKVARVRAALEKFNGSIPEAAEALGMERSALKGFIHDIRELRTQYAKPRTPELPPSEMEVVHREVLELNPKGGELIDQKTVMAIEKENGLLKKGLSALKLSEAGMELAHSFHRFQSENFSRSATIVAGGLIRRYVENEVELDKLWKEVELNKAPDADGMIRPMGEVAMMREKYLLDAIIQLTAVQQKAYKLIVDAGLTSAIIKQKLAGLNGSNGHKPTGKPGFGPKQRQTLVKVEQGATLNMKA